ncbi:hypothetical protein LX36DRAFT_719997 [Colletotrichum falcatum]|nr:hypothetical protein LX36DRAFT_719997 [Colletotrichum falcatum]
MVFAEVGLVQEALRERVSAALQHEGDSDSATTGSVSSLRSGCVKAFIIKAFLIGNPIFSLFVAGWLDELPDITPGIVLLFRNTIETCFTMEGGARCVHLVCTWRPSDRRRIATGHGATESLHNTFGAVSH